MIRLLIATALSLAFVGSAEAGPFKARRAAQADAACAPAATVAPKAAAPCATATVSVVKTYQVVQRAPRLKRVRSSGC